MQLLSVRCLNCQNLDISPRFSFDETPYCQCSSASNLLPEPRQKPVQPPPQQTQSMSTAPMMASNYDDELIQMFSRNLHLSQQQQQQHQRYQHQHIIAAAPPTPPMTASSPPSSHFSISQHYHHSGHQLHHPLAAPPSPQSQAAEEEDRDEHEMLDPVSSQLYLEQQQQQQQSQRQQQEQLEHQQELQRRLEQGPRWGEREYAEFLMSVDLSSPSALNELQIELALGVISVHEYQSAIENYKHRAQIAHDAQRHQAMMRAQQSNAVIATGNNSCDNTNNSNRALGENCSAMELLSAAKRREVDPVFRTSEWFNDYYGGVDMSIVEDEEAPCSPSAGAGGCRLRPFDL